MDATNYYVSKFKTEKGDIFYFIPLNSGLLPKDIVDHIIQTKKFNDDTHLEAQKKAKKRVYVVKSIQPFETRPTYKALQFVKDHNNTFKNVFMVILNNYRKENNLPTPLSYECHATKNQIIPQAAPSSTNITSYEVLEKLNRDLYQQEMSKVSQNNATFVNSFLDLPLIDQICLDIPLQMIWQFLTHLILEKYTDKDKQKAYLQSCRFYSYALICANYFAVNDQNQARSYFELAMNTFKDLTTAGIDKKEEEQLVSLYTPFINWIQSLFELKDHSYIKHQIGLVTNKIKTEKLSDQYLAITQTSSLKQYLSKWMEQSISFLMVALACTPSINEAKEQTSIESLYLIPLSKALMFNNIYAAHQIIVDIEKKALQIHQKALIPTTIDFATKLIIHQPTFEQYLTIALQQVASNCLSLTQSIMQRDRIHQVISQESIDEMIQAQDMISQFDKQPKPDLKVIYDWVKELKFKGHAPQALNQLLLLNQSWTELKNICHQLSSIKALSLLLSLCAQRTENQSIDLNLLTETYFIAVKEINANIPVFHGILEKINEQVCTFQGICCLSKSNPNLPQIKTPALIEQFDRMNERLKRYIQPIINLLNGFQQVLQFNREHQGTSIKSFSELTLQFKTEEITVHLFGTSPEAYSEFDKLIVIPDETKEHAEFTVEIDEIDLIEQVSPLSTQQLTTDSPFSSSKTTENWEGKIKEIFENKKTKKIQKNLFEFFKEEKIDFKTIFGKGDHLKLYLNGRPIPLPQHIEWKPGTKGSIEKDVLEGVKKIKSTNQ